MERSETSHLDALRSVGVPDDIKAQFGGPEGAAQWDRLIDNAVKQMAQDPEIQKALQEEQQQQQAFTVVPEPAFVIKTALLKSTDTYPSGFKLFINIAHSPYIPAPPVATDEEIRAAINGGNGEWKVPMSLTAPRDDIDKGAPGRPCVVFDACINSDVLHKAEKDTDFKLFIIELAVEWVEEKHKMSLSRDFTLPKLRSKGPLHEHKIFRPKRAGISQLADGTKTNWSPKQQQQQPRMKQKPKYTVTESGDRALMVRLELPNLASAKSAALDVEERRLVFDGDAYAVSIDLPKPVNIDHHGIDAEFNLDTRILSVQLFC
ncbi:hypothetical protein RI367_007422 [Sorochytrium milnesiophthora]